MYFPISIDMAFCFCQAIYTRNRITDKKSSETFIQRYIYFLVNIGKSKDLLLRFFYNIKFSNNTSINN